MTQLLLRSARGLVVIEGLMKRLSADSPEQLHMSKRLLTFMSSQMILQGTNPCNICPATEGMADPCTCVLVAADADGAAVTSQVVAVSTSTQQLQRNMRAAGAALQGRMI